MVRPRHDAGAAAAIGGAALIGLGISLLVIAGLRGEAQLQLFLIIPVVTATGPLALLGTVLLAVGPMLLVTGLAQRGLAGDLGPGPGELPDGARRASRDSRGHASGPPGQEGSILPGPGLVLIGPFPLLLGTRSRWAQALSGVLLILMVLSLAGLLLAASPR